MLTCAYICAVLARVSIACVCVCMTCMCSWAVCVYACAHACMCMCTCMCRHTLWVLTGTCARGSTSTYADQRAGALWAHTDIHGHTHTQSHIVCVCHVMRSSDSQTQTAHPRILYTTTHAQYTHQPTWLMQHKKHTQTICMYTQAQWTHIHTKAPVDSKTAVTSDGPRTHGYTANESILPTYRGSVAKFDLAM
jgi:hypothetical protein